MADVIAIGCRLPNGFIFTPHPDENLARQGKQVVLNGANKSHHFEGVDLDKIILQDIHYGVTVMEKSLWAKIKETWGENFGPIKSGAIFEAKNDREVAAKVKEIVQEKQKTGFEAAQKDSAGVESATK